MIPGEELSRRNRRDIHDIDNYYIYRSEREEMDNSRGDRQVKSLALIAATLLAVVGFAWMWVEYIVPLF